MNSALKSTVSEIIEASYYRPAISILLPFDTKMSLKSEVNHTLKIAVDRVLHEIKENYPTEMFHLMSVKLRSLVANLNFMTHKKSIAIYLSPVFEKVLYLDIPVREKTIVGDTFEIRDLIHNKKQTDEYLVLILSSSEARILYHDTSSFIKVFSGTARSLHVISDDIPQQVGNFTDASGRKEMLMDKFLRQVDKKLGQVLPVYPAPVFVVATKKTMGHFKQITAHAHAVVEYIHGNHDETTVPELLKILDPYTSQWEKMKQKNILKLVQHAEENNKLVCGMRDVWKEAARRNGRLLVVEKDYMYTGQRGSDRTSIYMPARPYYKFALVKDAVDEVIQTVLENGGDVEFADPGNLEEYHHIALLKYHS